MNNCLECTGNTEDGNLQAAKEHQKTCSVFLSNQCPNFSKISSKEKILLKIRTGLTHATIVFFLSSGIVAIFNQLMLTYVRYNWSALIASEGAYWPVAGYHLIADFPAFAVVVGAIAFVAVICLHLKDLKNKLVATFAIVTTIAISAAILVATRSINVIGRGFVDSHELSVLARNGFFQPQAFFLLGIIVLLAMLSALTAVFYPKITRAIKLRLSRKISDT